MKNSYMHQMYVGTIGDMKTLEHHFALMAEKGWMIDKIGLFTHRYRAIEPEKKRFFVDLLLQITVFDYPENEDAQDYRSICEESGWTFVAANKQFHVFCADGENPDPIPIHTDNTVQAKIFLKACRKYEMLWMLYAVFMLWLSSPIGKGVELFLSNILLFTTIGYCFFLIGFVWTFGFIISWYMRTRKSAKNNLPLPKVNYRLSKLRNKVLKIGSIIFVVCMIAGIILEIIGGESARMMLLILMLLSGFCAGLWIRRQIDTRRRTRAANIGLYITVAVILIVFSSGISIAVHGVFSSQPESLESLNSRTVLTLSDAGIIEAPSSSSTYIDGTFAVPVEYGHWEACSSGSTRTQVYRTINKTLTRWLYEHCAEEFGKEFGVIRSIMPEIIILTPDEAAFWGAEEGMVQFYTESNAVELLLLNGKTILHFFIEGENMNLETVSQTVKKMWNDTVQTQLTSN